MFFKFNLLSSIGFQTPATTVMEAIVDMHHYVFFYLILVFVFVIYMYGHILFTYFFIPTYLYDISFKLNNDSFIFFKFIRLFIFLFLNFDFFSSYICYFTNLQTVRIVLRYLVLDDIRARFLPTEFPYRLFPEISDIIYVSEVIFVENFNDNNEYNNISLELADFLRIELTEINPQNNVVFLTYQNIPHVFQTFALRRHKAILHTRLINHNSNLELILTLIPSFFLFLIALPSFALLYEFDEILAAAITFKVIGYQLFLTYEMFELYVNKEKVTDLHEFVLLLKNLEHLNIISDEEILTHFAEIDLENKIEYLETLNNVEEISFYNIKGFPKKQKEKLIMQDHIIRKNYNKYLKRLYKKSLKHKDLEFIFSDELNSFSTNSNKERNSFYYGLLGMSRIYDTMSFIKLLDSREIPAKYTIEQAYKNIISVALTNTNVKIKNNKFVQYMYNLKRLSRIRFQLKYLLDELLDRFCVDLTILKNIKPKVELVNNTFDSVMILEENLQKGEKRLLEVDNPLVLPFNYVIQAIITAGDVLHSLAVPAFGIKVDAVPGRLNQVQFLIIRPGTFYGQCSELCGVNHGFMPIVIKVPFSHLYMDNLLNLKL